MEKTETNNEKLLLSVYNDLASPGVKQVGESVGNLLKFVALPFKFLGLTAEQLEQKYSKFIQQAINRVPPEKLTSPQSSIVSPLLDYAKFTFTPESGNDLLQGMFSNLLSSAMDQDRQQLLQKSFVENMRFLSKNEANILMWCYDTIVVGKYIESMRPSSFSGFSILSLFRLHDNTEILVTTPGKLPYNNFSVIESLELLSSLGLINYREERSSGFYFFNDLHELIKANMINFEISPLFYSALNQLKTFKKIHLPYHKKEDAEYYLLQVLLSYELPELQPVCFDKGMSVEQLMDMAYTRFEVTVTNYGRAFLQCCIS